MKYLEIAQGSPRNRGLLIAKESLVKYIKKDEALFRSTYLYDDDAMDYVNSKGSLRDFFGKRYIDKIIIDIDKKDNSDELTQSKAIDIVNKLEDFGVYNNSYIIFFSGTGYHITVANDVFGFEPSPDLPLKVKSTLVKLFPEVDAAVYIRTAIYRVQHTINKKKDLYKIPLTKEELMNFEPKRIQSMAQNGRYDFTYTPLEGKNQLNKYIINDLPKIISMKSVVEPKNNVPCVQDMLMKGPREGGRAKTALRIASHFRRHGIPSDFAKLSLLHWNNKSLNDKKIIDIVENTYNYGYQHACSDEIMREHCKTNCIHFQRKDYLIGVKSSGELQQDLHERLTTNFQGRTIKLSKMLGLNVDSDIYPGELVTIFGPTGSNKTTFAQNIALGMDFVNNRINREWQIPTLFLSLELSDWYMHRRHLQIVADVSKEDATDNYDGIYEKHKDELSHLVVQTISPTIKDIQTKIKELQPALVVVDYIDLIEVPRGRAEYDKIKHVSHSLSNLAVNMDVIIIQISQVARNYSRNDVLDLYAGKGSGAIENASRKVIGLNGQANETAKTVHMFKNTDGDSNWECDVEWHPSFRLRRTNV